MSALVTTLSSEPVGPYASLLPLIPHAVGVGGYEHRYIASSLSGAAGTLITAWPDVKGANPLTVRNGSPALADVDGVRGVMFDGVDDRIGTAFSSGQKTVALVMKLLAADGVNTGILGEGVTGTPAADYPAVLRTGANQFAAFSDNASPATTSGTSAANIKSWGIMFARVDTANWRVRVNVSGSVLAPPGTGVPLTSMHLAYSAGVYGNIVVAEAITWPTMLSDVDLQTVQTVLRGRYPILPAS